MELEPLICWTTILLKTEVEEVEGNMIKNANLTNGETGFDNWNKEISNSGVGEFVTVEKGLKFKLLKNMIPFDYTS